MNIVMNWHTCNISDYSYLDKFSETAAILYQYSKTLKEFSDIILLERSHEPLGIHLVNYGINFNTVSLRESLSMQTNKLNCLIRFSMIKENKHYEKLSLVNKDIRCGLIRYKFLSKNKGFDIQKFMNHDFTSHIYSFLSDEERTAMLIAKTYDPEKTQKCFNKIPLKHIINSKYVTYSQYNRLNECERLLKVESPRKSWQKKKILEQLEQIGKRMYQCYNMNPIELMPLLKDMDRYEDLQKHYLFTRTCLIETNYAKKYARFNEALHIWGEKKVDAKKKKTRTKISK